MCKFFWGRVEGVALITRQFCEAPPHCPEATCTATRSYALQSKCFWERNQRTAAAVSFQAQRSILSLAGEQMHAGRCCDATTPSEHLQTKAMGGLDRSHLEYGLGRKCLIWLTTVRGHWQRALAAARRTSNTEQH